MTPFHATAIQTQAMMRTISRSILRRSGETCRTQQCKLACKRTPGGRLHLHAAMYRHVRHPALFKQSATQQGQRQLPMRPVQQHEKASSAGAQQATHPQHRLHAKERHQAQAHGNEQQREPQWEEDAVAQHAAHGPLRPQVPVPVPRVGRRRCEAAEEGVINECVGRVAHEIGCV